MKKNAFKFYILHKYSILNTSNYTQRLLLIYKYIYTQIDTHTHAYMSVELYSFLIKINHCEINLILMPFSPKFITSMLMA